METNDGETSGDFYEDPETGEQKQAGCLCFLSTKNQMQRVNCWLYDKTAGEYGWPHALNGKPKNHETH